MFDNISPESIRKSMTDALTTDIDVREGSFTADILSPVSVELWKLYASLNELISIAYPDESSGEYIDRKCSYYGIVRKTGTKAEVILTITGTDGKVVPKGTAFLNAENLRFLLEKDAKISEGKCEVLAVAADVGSVYNIAAGEVFRPLNSLSGIETVINTAAAYGGTDPESDVSLLQRLYARLREPATSGNIYHYRQWALACEGVGEARVIPLWAGPGTVKVLIASDEKTPVDDAVITSAFEYIESQRPIGAAVTVATIESLNIDIAADLAIDTSTTLEEVKTAFEKALDNYFKEIALVQYTVPYIRIGYLLAGIDGVLDYSNLTINGGVANITVGSEQVPQRGTVTLNEST